MADTRAKDANEIGLNPLEYYNTTIFCNRRTDGGADSFPYLKFGRFLFLCFSGHGYFCQDVCERKRSWGWGKL